MRHIAVAPDQHRFSGTVQEAFDEAEEGVDFHGIFEGERAVGFFKIDRLYAARFPFVSQGELGLRAFMVDLAQQGRGIATKAVTALPSYLAEHYPNTSMLWLTVNISNPAALRAYLKGGFTDTSEQWPHGDAGPQRILRLDISSQLGM